MQTQNLFATVPAITLPGGLAVSSFQVGQYLCGKGADGKAVVTAEAKPWVRINHAEARQACTDIGGHLITESQYLAIALDIVGQDINWTGGKVGEGNVYQGLHLDTVDEAQAGDFVSEDPLERSWHQLSNGERLYGFAGNAYSWVFDNIQGDENGLVASAFEAESPSIATAPYPSMERGMGWRPKVGADWSGYALLRGGCWHDEDDAGVFDLDYGWHDYRGDFVGFRCTN